VPALMGIVSVEPAGDDEDSIFVRSLVDAFEPHFFVFDLRPRERDDDAASGDQVFVRPENHEETARARPCRCAGVAGRPFPT